MLELGWWLFARLAVHQRYNTMPKNRRVPLTGLGLSDTDWLEIVQLELALNSLRAIGPKVF